MAFVGLVGVLSLSSGCGHRSRTAMGPKFAPVSKAADKALVYFFRPDKMSFSAYPINLSVIPVPAEQAHPLAQQIKETWKKAKDGAIKSISFGQIVGAVAKGAAIGAVRGATAVDISKMIEEEKPAAGASAEIPHCWVLDNNGFFSLTAEAGLVLVYNSGGNVDAYGVKPKPGVTYLKVEPVTSGFTWEAEVTTVPEAQALEEMKEVRGVDRCKAEQ
jgi:hypothetical protein